jgi:DNA invertase Pin-like site-specific DNA recombinase
MAKQSGTMGVDRKSARGEEELQSKPLRCAIYTRKSTEEGLNQEFNTLEAQREAAEAYIRSQVHAGWTALGERYDDGGFTGANLDRPALRKLLADIESGGVDAVIVYKVDRLSRSLLDFARLMEVFERHKVNLVSVTQPLNTTSSLGRLTLNILLSFAEFERQLIRDRTRDKMAAARRRGKWVGGTPVLGYDIADGGGKLVVNTEEADQVRQIFAVYVKYRSLETTLVELGARRWTTKHWRTREGKEHVGRPFTKATLVRLLKNVLYLGQVSHQGQVYDAEQGPIVEPAVWRRANEKLAKERNGHRPQTARAPRRPRSRLVVERSERVPRVTRLLALALKFEDLIRSGEVSNYATMAQIGQVSRSRVTQMTSLLNLAPDIQEEILFLRSEEAQRSRISEPSLRKLTAMLLWSKQREEWRSLRRPSRNGIEIVAPGSV